MSGSAATVGGNSESGNAVNAPSSGNTGTSGSSGNISGTASHESTGNPSNTGNPGNIGILGNIEAIGKSGSPSTMALTLALSGIRGTLEKKDLDLLCPVCFELIEEAYVTRCGHSFCYSCISKSVELHRRCPKCGTNLNGRDHYFPNFLLNELVARRRTILETSGAVKPKSHNADSEHLKHILANETRNLGLSDVEGLLDVLARRKRVLEAESAIVHHKLLYDFLDQLLQNRTRQLEQLKREASLVKKDLDHVDGILKVLRATEGTSSASEVVTTFPMREDIEELPEVPRMPDEEEETFAGKVAGAKEDFLKERWRRLTAHFEDFVQCYFAHRSDELYFSSELDEATDQNAGGDAKRCEDAAVPPMTKHVGTQVRSEYMGGLEGFREDLAAFSRYRDLRPLATLSYCNDAINYSTIVSTIEFDKDDEFFAIAGVTKRIKVFEFESVIRDTVDVHYPCAEMQCSHKISCVSWNAYHKHVLASADYEGTVAVWDAATGVRTRALHEHDKRCWSVHFNRADVRLLASGSDDARVKLWSLNAERSVATLEAKFNVCCVRFNPRSSCHLAFGSADHCVHYYDLRAPRAPLAVFRDHKKAVSYVKWVDAHTLVSASTDSQLKLWRVESPRCVRSFTGHTNEKNFVGLATDGKYVACGSENNALFVYYAGLSKPVLTYTFEAVRGFLERATRDEEPSEFVSAVCWRKSPDRPVLLAANSQGTIKVLEPV